MRTHPTTAGNLAACASTCGSAAWSDLTVTGGVHAAIAVGAQGSRDSAKAAVVDPATATAAALLRLGWQLAPGVAGHPLLAELADGIERVRNRQEHVAGDALRTLLRRVVDRQLTAIDLTELVRSHVGLDALAAELDVDAVIARADVDAVIARTDLDAIVKNGRPRRDRGPYRRRGHRPDDRPRGHREDDRPRRGGEDGRPRRDRRPRRPGRPIRVRIDVDAIISRVDIDQITSGIDLDAIVARIEPGTVVARVDVEAVLDRLDLTTIARQVLEAIDLPGILRRSTGAVSSQAARVVRTKGMHADESVSRFIDRVLRRPHHPGGHDAVAAAVRERGLPATRGTAFPPECLPRSG